MCSLDKATKLLDDGQNYAEAADILGELLKVG
jgi:hypothetical protein